MRNSVDKLRITRRLSIELFPQQSSTYVDFCTRLGFLFCETQYTAGRSGDTPFLSTQICCFIHTPCILSFTKEILFVVATNPCNLIMAAMSRLSSLLTELSPALPIQLSLIVYGRRIPFFSSNIGGIFGSISTSLSSSSFSSKRFSSTT